MSEIKSKLVPFSLGIAVENKPRGTDIILVSPIEELNIQPFGSIKEYTKDFKGEQPDIKSVSFKTEHESKNYIKAKWLPYGESNRTTAPDVCINETIMIYKYGDVDEYYWFDIMREPELRRLEDVLYSYSNMKNGVSPYDANSSYWVRFNTKDKFIQIHTSKNDGEPFIYDITINTKVGTVTLNDDVGNLVQLDSSSNTVNIKTNKDINLDAAGSINIKSGNSILLESNSITNKASVVINDSPMVKNNGKMETSGSHLAFPNLNPA